MAAAREHDWDVASLYPPVEAGLAWSGWSSSGPAVAVIGPELVVEASAACFGGLGFR